MECAPARPVEPCRCLERKMLAVMTISSSTHIWIDACNERSTGIISLDGAFDVTNAPDDRGRRICDAAVLRLA